MGSKSTAIRRINILAGHLGAATCADSPQPGDPLEEKKERIEGRKALIEKARFNALSLNDSDKATVLAAADRLERNNLAVERARLSADVYDAYKHPPQGPPLGWTRLSDDPQKLAPGLSPNDFAPPDSGFRAALYKSQIDGSIVVAFKGTESAEDWSQNLAQAAGFQSDYYDRSIHLGKKLKDLYGETFETTGHSLGGGLASAASVAVGIHSTTFNAAGLHPNAVRDYGKNRIDQEAHLIEAFHVSGEPLTAVQEHKGKIVIGAGAAVGGYAGIGSAMVLMAVIRHLNLIPVAVGESHDLPAVNVDGSGNLINNPLTLHGIGSVINGLEKEKRDDQSTLFRFTSP